MTPDPDLSRLRDKDPDAFSDLIDRHSPMMLRLARGIVGAEIAEEVVQDAWLAAFDAIASFEGRSSIRTWLGQIVLNRAKTRAKREARTTPFSSVGSGGDDDAEIDRLVARNGEWISKPSPWTDAPDALVHRREVREALEAALDGLPELQRLVVTLRDIEGMSAEEVCHVLEVSESNQRQILHRGRLRMRLTLEHLGRKP